MNESFIFHTNDGIYIQQNNIVSKVFDILDGIDSIDGIDDLSVFRIAETVYIFSKMKQVFHLYNIDYSNEYTSNNNKESYIISLHYTKSIPTSLSKNHSELFLTSFKNTLHFVCFNNNNHHLEFYNICDHHWTLSYSTLIDINMKDNDYINHIDFQDHFIYLLSNNQHLFVISPNYQVFGDIQIHTNNSVMLHPKLIGTYLYYINSNKTLYKYCLINRTLTKLANECQYFSYVDKKITILRNNQLYDLDSFKILYTCNHITIHKFITVDINNDIRHGNSVYNSNNYVQTFFLDEMDANLQHISITLCDIAKKLYDNKALMQNMKLNTNKRYYPFLRSPYKNMYFGKDVYDLVKVKDSFFNDYTNYQELLNDMSSLNLDHTNRSSVNPFVDHVQQYIIKQGIDINPFYILSGPFHFTWPMCGKGWHHNIENVPRQKCDVIYFITTDQNHYGGSFFFYRHPHSHLIHAVPDVHATMKLFQLVSNTENPLWHALGSFTAHRISWGLSRRSEMYPSEDDKINNPVVIHEMNQSSE